MTQTTWGQVVAGDLVLDPATEQVYLVTAIRFAWNSPTGGEKVLAYATLRYGKDEFPEIVKPTSEPVEVTAHSERTAVDGMVKVTQPGFVVDNNTGETSPGVLNTYVVEPATPDWMPQPNENLRQAAAAETQFRCGQCGNRTYGIMHQRLRKGTEQTYCTWPCGHEVVGEVISVCQHPSHASAAAEADAHYGLREVVAEETAKAYEREIDAAAIVNIPLVQSRSDVYFEQPCHFCGGHYHYDCACMYECRVCGVIGHEHSGVDHAYELQVNPPVVQEPETAEKQDAEAGAVAAAFGEHKVEMIASETVEEQQARESATMDDPWVVREITEPLELRSHLYLAHGIYVAELDVAEQSTAAALREHHRKGHADGPMTSPHIHKES